MKVINSIKRSSLLRFGKSYSKIFNKQSFTALLLLFFFAMGCKKVTEETGLIGVCPIVISTDPANGAINVVTSKVISATFNEGLNPASVNATTFLLKQGTNQVSGTISYANRVATFTPSSPLLANTVYTATITTGIRDSARNAMKANYVWSFNTGSTPIVVSTDPPNGAVDVPFNKVITATFSTIMDAATINASSFMIRQAGVIVPGTISYSGFVATFTPTVPLPASTVFTGTVTTAVKDVAGNAMASNYNWSFSTGAAPIVTSTDPPNGATNVLLNKVITASFNKTMDASTINTTTFTLKQGTTAVAGTVTYANKVASFTPSALLSPNTTYTGTISTGVKDSSGNSLANNYVWTFTTGNAPMVIATDPPNNAVNVPQNKVVTASFSTAMDPSTINGSTFILKQGTNNVAGTVTYAGTTATFTPSVPFTTNTVYTGTITTGAKDLLGNALPANYTWSFTTTGNSPAVTSTDPTNGAVNVPINKIVTATFNKSMDATTINALTFMIKQGTNQVFGTVTYSGTVATFTPAQPFAASTLYTATITTGAKDMNGNPLPANYVWSFTTGSQTGTAPFLGSASIMGAFGGNAGITNQGLNTVINNGAIATTAASTLITGFHDGLTGDIYTETPLNKGLVTLGIFTAPPAPGTSTSFNKASNASLDAIAAYNSISPAGRPGGTDPGAGELGGLTLPPGVYKAAAGTFKITNGNLTLDAQGDPNAVWIFQTAAGLTVGIAGPAGARSVNLINGGQANNVYWYVGSAAVINAAGGGVMTGTIISSQGVALSTAGNAVQTVLNGRAISLVASVTMVNTTINVP